MRFLKYPLLLSLLLMPLVHAAGTAEGPATTAGLLPPADRLPALLRVAADQRHRSCVPQAPLEARLDLAALPRAGRPVRLVLSALPQAPMSDPEVRWALPPGVRVQDEPVLAGKPLSAGVVAQFSRTIVFPGPGEWELSASLIQAQPGRTWGRQVKLWVRIGRDGRALLSTQPFPRAAAAANFSTRPLAPGERVTPAPEHLLHRVLPGRSHPEAAAQSDALKTGEAVRAGSVRIQAGSIVVKGRLTYRHNDGTFHGAFGTTAQLWDRDGMGDDFLGSVVLDANGSFEFPAVTNTDGEWGDNSALDPYIVWWSENGIVDVFRPGLGGETFAVRYDLAENIADGTHDVLERTVDHEGPGTYPDDGTEGAYELVDTVSRGWVHYLQLGHELSIVDVVWEPGYDPTGQQGAYYEGLLKRMTLADGQHNDASVVLHEYGHHTEQVLKGWWMPGGAHSWFGHTNDRLAFSEGWASYSGQSTLGHPRYLDRPGFNGGGTLDVNMERETGDSPGSNVEASVCAALWDLYDNLPGDPQPHDFVTDGVYAITDAFVNGGNVDTITDFRDAWIKRGQPQEIDGIFRDHFIYPFVKADTSTIVSNATRAGSGPVELKAHVTRNTDSEPVPGVTVVFSLNGTNLSAATDTSGWAKVTYAVPASLAGTTQITARCLGNDTYNSSTGQGTLEIASRGTSITFSLVDGVVGATPPKAKLTLRTGSGAPLGKRKINLFYSGPARLSASLTTRSDGTATIFYPGKVLQNAGDYQLKAEFRGDRSADKATATGYFRIAKAAVTLKTFEVSGRPGRKVLLRVRVLRAGTTGGKVKGVPAVFQISGQTSRVVNTSNSGEASWLYTIPATAYAGNITWTVQVQESKNYLGGSGTGTLKVIGNSPPPPR